MKKKIYQYEWIEMSGGFDQLINVETTTSEKAEELFMEFAKTQWKNPEAAREHVHKSCIQDTYTKKYIKEHGGIISFLRGLPITLKEKL